VKSKSLHKTGDVHTIKYLKDRISEQEAELDRQGDVANAIHIQTRNKRMALEARITELEAEIAQRHEAMVERVIEMDADKERIEELDIQSRYDQASITRYEQIICELESNIKKLEDDKKRIEEKQEAFIRG
jgi:BMFP domain-containing protein YqiC